QSGEYAKYTVLNGLDYGEWCEPGVTPMQAMANPRKSVGHQNGGVPPAGGHAQHGCHIPGAAVGRGNVGHPSV
ncbi:hypothetical protein, partial [Gemmiger formicilis]|uniref:hypothetical protein n=1 Tax=Gemmiger formicilis TaxID=745368 RepID=UPI001956FF46